MEGEIQDAGEVAGEVAGAVVTAAVENAAERVAAAERTAQEIADAAVLAARDNELNGRVDECRSEVNRLSAVMAEQEARLLSMMETRLSTLAAENAAGLATLKMELAALVSNSPTPPNLTETPPEEVTIQATDPATESGSAGGQEAPPAEVVPPAPKRRIRLV